MYDPTPADMEAISDCDVFIYTGDAMEGWAAQIVDSLDDSVYVLDLSQYVTLREEEEDGHDHEEEHHHHGAYDPHYWLDMTNAAAMARLLGMCCRIWMKATAGIRRADRRVCGTVAGSGPGVYGYGP